MKHVFSVRLVLAGFLAAACGCWLAACSREKAAADTSFQDEPPAHALYTQMIQAMRSAAWYGYETGATEKAFEKLGL